MGVEQVDPSADAMSADDRSVKQKKESLGSSMRYIVGDVRVSHMYLIFRNKSSRTR